MGVNASFGIGLRYRGFVKNQTFWKVLFGSLRTPSNRRGKSLFQAVSIVLLVPDDILGHLNAFPKDAPNGNPLVVN